MPGSRFSGRYLTISGPTLGSTVYKVVIPGTLGDVFGQTLGEPETVEFEIGEARPLIQLLGGGFTTLDPLGETAGGSGHRAPVGATPCTPLCRRSERLRVVRILRKSLSL